MVLKVSACASRSSGAPFISGVLTVTPVWNLSWTEMSRNVAAAVAAIIANRDARRNFFIMLLLNMPFVTLPKIRLDVYRITSPPPLDAIFVAITNASGHSSELFGLEIRQTIYC